MYAKQGTKTSNFPFCFNAGFQELTTTAAVDYSWRNEVML